jgi:hypothetical protein
MHQERRWVRRDEELVATEIRLQTFDQSSFHLYSRVISKSFGDDREIARIMWATIALHNLASLVLSSKLILADMNNHHYHSAIFRLESACPVFPAADRGLVRSFQSSRPG